MDSKKVGMFIKSLREKNGLTQEALSKKIFLDRTAISKWERGATTPDPETLLTLSDIFNVSINEILMGEYIDATTSNEASSDEVVFELYKKDFKNKKIIRKLIILVFIVLFSLLFLYFITFYKSTKIYMVTGYNSNVTIDNGFLAYTKEKYYFSIGNISLIDNKRIERLDLLIKYKNDEMKLINSVDNNYFYIVDISGYDEYDLINFIKDDYKVFIKVHYDNSFDMVELKFVKDYENRKIFPFRARKSSVSNDKIINNSISENSIINNVVNILSEESNSIVIKVKNNLFSVSYDSNANFISVFHKNKVNNNQVWNYNIESNVMSFIDNNFSFFVEDNNVHCTDGICDEWKELNDTFWNVLQNLINIK